jgi:hypothetical protein
MRAALIGFPHQPIVPGGFRNILKAWLIYRVLERMWPQKLSFTEGVQPGIASKRTIRMEEVMKGSLQENLARRLSDSVERLQQQAQNVEFWASAVTSLAQPVPDYEPETTHVERYLKPTRPPRKRRRRAANQNMKGEPDSTDRREGATRSKPASA